MIPIVEPAGAVNDMFSSDLSPAPLYVRSTFSNTTSAPFEILSADLFINSFSEPKTFSSSVSLLLSALSDFFILPNSSSSDTKSSIIDGFISNTDCILFPQATAFVESTMVFASFISSTRICDI